MSKHILIVEDDELVADQLPALVRDQLDCSPVVATSTGEAMAFAAQHINFGFLDVQLADGTYAVASVYFYNAPLGKAARIQSGDYLEHMKVR